eukprot:8886339-Prorocentrum_lima.AAC.1
MQRCPRRYWVCLPERDRCRSKAAERWQRCLMPVGQTCALAASCSSATPLPHCPRKQWTCSATLKRWRNGIMSY